VGAFFGVVYLRTGDRDAVRPILDQLARKRRFLLGPALHGWTAVYPQDHGQDSRVAKAIARRFPGELLHVLVHDDDIFAYSYYRDGKLRDEYNSCPDYFEEMPAKLKERCRGRPRRLAHLLAPGKTLAELQELLSPEAAGGVVFAGDLLGRFADLLGLANAQTSYEYLQGGEGGGIEGEGQFLHVPDLSGEKARKREAGASIERVKERLHAEGLLLLERTAPGTGSGFEAVAPAWCPDREGSGFLVSWGRLVQASATPLERYGPPWAGPADTGLVAQGTPQLLALSPSGRYLAASCLTRGEWKVELWDLETADRIAEAAWPRYVDWVGFSPDDQFLVMLSGGDGAGKGVVADVRSGRPVSSFPLDVPQRATVHPSGAIIVAGGRGKLAFVDLTSGHVRQTLFVGGRQDLSAEHQALAAQVQQQLAQIDPQVLEQQIRDGMAKQIKAIEQAARRGAPPEGVGAEEMIRRFREQMEKTIAEMKRQYEQRQQAGPAGLFPPQGTEQVTALECSPDGRLVFCATDRGVRVFAWDALLAAKGQTPAPVLAVASEPVTVEAGRGMAVSHRIGAWGLAHDAAGNRLLFGGLEGKVGFLDLVTGRSGTLLDPPGRPAVQRLGLSRDRGSLCCTCQPDLLVQRKRRPALLQVWNYAALEQRLVDG